MLAEDDLDDQALFREFLQHRTDITMMPVAENGVVLLEYLENIRQENNLPDLIILDQNMPKMNGLKTLQALKETDRYAHITVVIYSTYTDPELIRNGFGMGAARILPKPISKAGYEEMIDDFLKAVG